MLAMFASWSRSVCSKSFGIGVVPWEWVVDNTRGLSVPSTFDGIGEGLRALANQYRRDPWNNQNSIVFVLTEKDGVATILEQETKPYCVPIGVVHGFGSHTFLHALATLSGIGRSRRKFEVGNICYFIQFLCCIYQMEQECQVIREVLSRRLL
jgi:hypothetical protein